MTKNINKNKEVKEVKNFKGEVSEVKGEFLNKALKNVLYGLARDFNLMAKMSRYNAEYVPSEKDFDKLGAKIFKAVKKYEDNQAGRLTSKMMTNEDLDLDEVKEYFKDVDREWKDNFELYLQEVVAVKGFKLYEAFVDLVETKKTKVSGKENNFENAKDLYKKMELFVEYIHNEAHKVKALKKVNEGSNMIKMNREFGTLKENGLPIKTGLDWLDEIIGGWTRGEVSLLSGCSNQGKTTFAIQIISYAVVVLDLKVKFINLELVEREIYGKIMGLMSGEGYQKHNIDNYDASNKDQVEKHSERFKKDKNIIKTYFGDKLSVKTGTYTVEMLINEIRESEADNFDMIVVDYFQLLNVGTDDGKAKAQRLSEAQELVREEVRKTNCAFIWLTQLKEETEKDKEGNLKVKPLEYEIAWCRDLYKGAGLEVRVWRDYEDVETRTFKPSMTVGLKKTRFANRVEPKEFAFNGAVGRIGEFAEIKTDEELKREASKNPDYDSYYDDYEEVEREFYDIPDQFDLMEEWIDEMDKEKEKQEARKEEARKQNKQNEEDVFNEIDKMINEE